MRHRAYASPFLLFYSGAGRHTQRAGAAAFLAADRVGPLGAAAGLCRDQRARVARCYAAAQIPEAWLVDVASDIVEQYWQPRNGKYLLKRLVERGDIIIAQSITKLELAVDAIFD
jgi:Putative restriction endonuclease